MMYHPRPRLSEVGGSEMNAAEAAKAAKQVREERSAARKKAEEARIRKVAADWKKERADFLVQFRKDVDEYIAEAVRTGKKHIDIEYLAKCGVAHTLGDAENWYEASLLRDSVEKVFAHFRGKGFSIKMRTFTHEHYCNYETSDEKYQTYSRGCTISWDK